jgi:hypothetical protein
MNKKYSNIATYKLDNIDRTGYIIKDFLINNNNNNINKIFEGNCFLIDLVDFQYFHLIYDQIGQYEFLKQHISNLQPIFILNNKKDYQNSIYFGNLVIKDILNIYNVNESNIIYANENESYLFKNIFYFNNLFVKFLNQFKTNEILYNKDGNDFIEYNLKIVEILKNKFIKYYTIKEPNKIFISRKKENAKLKLLHEIIYSNKNLELNDLKLIESYGGNIDYCKNLIDMRYQLEEDQDIIENLFKSFGYKIVDPGELGFIDQINLYHNASHIAAIKGTGLANVIFSNKNVNVFMINTHINYRFWYEDIIKNVTNNFYQIPINESSFDDIEQNKINPKDVFSLNSILLSIKDHRDII